MRRVRTRTYLFDGVKKHLFMMHAAIFLFFAGLVEFLFAINDEVATVILVTVCIFGAAYIFLTAFPVLYYQCPYQTPLTSSIWYTVHYSRRTMKTEIDEKALKSALTSCSDDSQLETFVAKSYRIQNIRSLLNKQMNDPDDPQLSPHLDLLLTSCVDADISMDKGLRRQRAITCARAIGEISKASADLTTYLPIATCGKLRHLSRDHDPAIALEALSALAIYLMHSWRAAASSPPWPGDRRLLIVTEFISSVRSLIPLMEKLSYEDLEAIRKTLVKLCDKSDREEFSPDAQRKFAEKLAEVMRGEAEVKAEDQQLSTLPISVFQRTVELATLELVNALEVEFKDLLPKDSTAFT
ncbi:hypothetical protein BGW80DRAFT_1318805 [Lactifluus volemus]|nr:hypothetical protein BGW80DRAFT_1318805 [Lactifluus volemus]